MKILQCAFVIEYVEELIDNAELEHLMRLKAEGEDKNYYFLTINGNILMLVQKGMVHDS
jgi:hypothetical protein